MKRFLAIAIVLVVVILGARALLRSLAPEETKLRWRLEQMEAGYNEGDVGDTIRPIARSWGHEGHPGLDREAIHGQMVREFFQDRHPETRELLRRVDLLEETLVLELEGDSAAFTVEVLFERLVRDSWSTAWRAELSGQWRRGEGGWLLERTSHRNLENTQLSR